MTKPHPSYSLKRTIVTTFNKTPSNHNPDTDDLYDDGVYVLHLASPPASGPSSALSAALSDRSIVSFDRTTMQMQRQISNIHQKQITDLSMVDDNVVVSSSEDGFIKFFDLREHGNGVSACCRLPENEEALSISFGYQGVILATGSSEGIIPFFDVRALSNSRNKPQTQQLGQYVDAHSEEVTKVKFMHQNDMVLATGSEDGLVCIFDTSQPSEEHALKSVLNIEAPIRNLNFFGPKNQEGVSPGIWCMTGNETMSVWHWDSAQRMCSYSDSDLRQQLSNVAQNTGSESIDYLVGADWNDFEQKLSIIAGNSNGNAAIFSVSNDGSFSFQSELSRGHMGCIRAFDWCHSPNPVIITGGEDARLCEWSESSQNSTIINHSNTSSLAAKPRVTVGGGVSRKKKNRKQKGSSPY